MKLLHVADLHLGKRVNEFSMLEDQRYIFRAILTMVAEEKPDAVLIAGDVYDKSQPSTEAVDLLDAFLTALNALGQPVFMISGNHDSPERLGFGSRILQKNQLHIAGTSEGLIKKVALKDAHGVVNVFLLPFLKPAMARPHFEQRIESYDDAVRAVIDEASVDPSARNVLVAHQYVTSGAQQPTRSDSENLTVGGLDDVDVAAFDAFDYVALGHLHGPQRIGRETVRYAGSPLKYSFSEAHHKKSVALVELGVKGEVAIRLLPLTPLRDLREIKGPIADLLRIGREDVQGAEDYVHATLTDEAEIYDALGQLRLVYPNLMALDFDNCRSRQAATVHAAALGDVSLKSPMDLFSEFYEVQNHSELTPAQVHIMEQIFEQVGGSGA